MIVRITLAAALMLFQPAIRIALGQIAPHHESYVCNLAKIHLLKPGAYLSIRSGPNDHAAKIGQLPNGEGVYICDEEGDWLKVAYRGRKGLCGPPSPTKGLNVQKTALCQTGWVRRESVDIVSG